MTHHELAREVKRLEALILERAPHAACWCPACLDQRAANARRADVEARAAEIDSFMALPSDDRLLHPQFATFVQRLTVPQLIVLLTEADTDGRSMILASADPARARRAVFSMIEIDPRLLITAAEPSFLISTSPRRSIGYDGFSFEPGQRQFGPERRTIWQRRLAIDSTLASAVAAGKLIATPIPEEQSRSIAEAGWLGMNVDERLSLGDLLDLGHEQDP